MFCKASGTLNRTPVYSLQYYFVGTHDASRCNRNSELLEVVSKLYKTRFSAALSELIDDFDRILWELLANTDEHAKKDYLNKRNLSPNTRAVHVRIFQSNRKNLVEYNSENKALADYYSQVVDEGVVFFFEISVFDSGPGLVRRFLGEKWDPDISMEEEINTIKKCLVKGTSSVNDWTGKHKGYGLNEVLKLLTKRQGFLKIRSGFASIYRNLLKDDHVETTQFDEIALFDWNTGRSSDFTKMPFAEGTLLTMAFPLPPIEN